MKRTLAILGFSLCSVTIMGGMPAQAQTALGSGNALDSNLGVGTGGINTSAPVQNFRDRNLVITGDVVGGRAFRGFVGYSAESDFRDRLGSNDLFRFRAESAISSPQYFQIGTTYDQLRFGQELGMVEYRPSGSAAPASIVASNPIALSTSADRFDIDRRVAAAAIAFNQQQLVEPRIIGSGYDKNGQLLLYNASPVQGLTVEDARRSAGLAGLSTFDSLRMQQDFLSNKTPYTVGKQFETDFDRLLKEPESTIKPPDNTIKSEAGNAPVDATIQKDYKQVLKEVADRYARAQNVDQKSEPQVMKQLDQTYANLREQLTGQPANPNQPLDTAVRSGVGEVNQAQREKEKQPKEGTTTELVNTPKPPNVEYHPPNLEPAMRPPAADFAAILRHGQRIEHLSADTQDRFNEIMRQAEQNLRDGDYFMAERRFERALRFVPGHPLATLGTGHAQLGAGLYLSASLTLRTLFEHQPEMIDVTYAPELLPSPDRLQTAREAIEKLMQRDDVDQPDRAGYAFLLAYIGHQTANRELVEQGLNAMGQFDPQSKLLPVLREVWLGTGAQSPSTTQPAPPAAEPEK